MIGVVLPIKNELWGCGEAVEVSCDCCGLPSRRRVINCYGSSLSNSDKRSSRYRLNIMVPLSVWVFLLFFFLLLLLSDSTTVPLSNRTPSPGPIRMMHSRRAVPAGGISRQQLLTCDKNEKQLKKTTNQESRKDGKSEGMWVEERKGKGKESERKRGMNLKLQSRLGAKEKGAR